MNFELMQAPATEIGFKGEILDCDAHLYMEPEVMAEIVEGIGGGFVLEHVRNQYASEQFRKDKEAGKTDVWNIKGLGALGAYNAEERVAAMDAMGVAQQLVFPNTALRELRIDSDAARAAVQRYNDYVIPWTKAAKGRARAVCQVNMGQVGPAIAELERVLAAGATGVLLSCASAPGGVSPANEVWDPFWARLEEANVPALLHLSSGGLLSSDSDDPVIPPREFSEAKALKASFAMRPGAEEAIGPFFMLVAHLPIETYLISLVMGGVFERFPRLRWGVIECGAGWLGPMVERMEQHVELLAKVGVTYSLRPNEYIRRNVRVTPFWHESIDTMVARHGMTEVYVFSTDFPHVEGTRNPIARFKKTMTSVGKDYDRKFFVENARLLFPGA
jgi:predicted TIM-barrel fold metal-dependent hydrolase